MKTNYLCYVDNKSMMRVPDDVFELFLHHLDDEHPEYLYMSDRNSVYNIQMYFVGSLLVAFSLKCLD